MADNGCTSCSKGTSLYVFPLLVCDGKGYFYYNIKTNRQVHLIGFCNGIGSFVYQLKYLLSLGDVADFVHDNFDSKIALTVFLEVCTYLICISYHECPSYILHFIFLLHLLMFLNLWSWDLSDNDPQSIQNQSEKQNVAIVPKTFLGNEISDGKMVIFSLKLNVHSFLKILLIFALIFFWNLIIILVS